MGLFDIVGDLAELPARVALVPGKIVRVIDESTIDSGVGELVDDVGERTVGDLGRAVNRGLSAMED